MKFEAVIEKRYGAAFGWRWYYGVWEVDSQKFYEGYVGSRRRAKRKVRHYAKVMKRNASPEKEVWEFEL